MRFKSLPEIEGEFQNQSHRGCFINKYSSASAMGDLVITAEQKACIDIISVIETAGVVLKKSSSRYTGLCPFHDEKTPSFVVYPNQKFHCFGCGVNGDAIDFIQKFYNCNFKTALSTLGIEQGPVTKETRIEIRKRQLRKRLIERFRKWERETAGKLGDLIRTARRALTTATQDQIERYGSLYHNLSTWEYQHDILCSGDDRAKYELFGELRNVRL